MNIKNIIKKKRHILIVLAVVLADQLSKFLVRDFFESQDYPYLLLTPFFNLVSVWNKGVSFSMFTSYSVYGPYLLSFLALAIIAVLISWFRKEKDQRIRLAISFVIGGALSNVSDRLLFGAVYDFLDFYFKTYHWPAFNIADSAIFIGACIIVISSLFNNEKTE